MSRAEASRCAGGTPCAESKAICPLAARVGVAADGIEGGGGRRRRNGCPRPRRRTRPRGSARLGRRARCGTGRDGGGRARHRTRECRGSGRRRRTRLGRSSRSRRRARRRHGARRRSRARRCQGAGRCARRRRRPRRRREMGGGTRRRRGGRIQLLRQRCLGRRGERRQAPRVQGDAERSQDGMPIDRPRVGPRDPTEGRSRHPRHQSEQQSQS